MRRDRIYIDDLNPGDMLVSLDGGSPRIFVGCGVNGYPQALFVEYNVVSHLASHLNRLGRRHLADGVYRVVSRAGV